MSELKVLADHLFEMAEAEFSGTHKCEIREVEIRDFGKTWSIDMTPHMPRVRYKRCYEVVFAVEVIGILYLKGSHHSFHEYVAGLHYSDPETTPEKVIEILKKCIAEEPSDER